MAHHGHGYGPGHVGGHHMPHGGHHAHGHHGAQPAPPPIPMFRTYWRMPMEPPVAARQHLTFNDRRHMGQLMSHYKAMICHLQGEIECMDRDSCDKQMMMEHMACLLESMRQQERQQKLKECQDQLEEWQKSEAMKMQAEIGRVKDESAEMVDNAAEACQQATANLNEAALVNPDGTFSPQGKTAVTEVVVDAVTNMQDEGALPPPQEVQDRRMMEQLTQMEEKINAEKSREIQDLHTEIEKTKKRYKKIIRDEDIEEEVIGSSPHSDDELHNYVRRKRINVEEELGKLTSLANETIGQEVGKRMDAELDDMQKYRSMLEEDVKKQISCIAKSAAGDRGPSMAEIQGLVSSTAQKISDDAIANGVKSLTGVNKEITNSLTDEVRRELSRMECGFHHLLETQNDLARKMSEESQILDAKLRVSCFVEEAEDSLKETRLNRIIQDRVSDAENKIRDVLGRQYMNDLNREVALARDQSERQCRAAYQTMLQQALEEQQRQLRCIRQALHKEYKDKEESLEKEICRLVDDKEAQIKALRDEVNNLKDKHFREMEHKEYIFAQERSKLVADFRCKYEMISLHEEERLSQIQAELAVISHAEGQQKLQIAELSQSLALARDENSHLREQMALKDTEFRRVIMELENALEECETRKLSTNEIICALQDLGCEETREVIQSVDWMPTVDELGNLVMQLDCRDIAYVIEQRLGSIYWPSPEYLMSKIDATESFVQEDIIKRLFELDLKTGLEAIQGLSGLAQHEIIKCLCIEMDNPFCMPPDICGDTCGDPCGGPCVDPCSDPCFDPCRDPWFDPCGDPCRDPCSSGVKRGNKVQPNCVGKQPLNKSKALTTNHLNKKQHTAITSTEPPPASAPQLNTKTQKQRPNGCRTARPDGSVPCKCVSKCDYNGCEDRKCERKLPCDRVVDEVTFWDHEADCCCGACQDMAGPCGDVIASAPHLCRRPVIVTYPELLQELGCRTEQEIFSLIDEACPHFFDENVLGCLLASRGYVICSGDIAPNHMRAGPMWSSLDREQLFECVENWYQHNPEDIKGLMQRFSMSPSNQELVCFLQYKNSNEIVDLLFMLGPETVHAVAKDILQGMPYEEAVMLLGTMKHHRGSHQLQPVTAPGYRGHFHGYREPVNMNGVHVRKHIHY